MILSEISSLAWRWHEKAFHELKSFLCAQICSQRSVYGLNALQTRIWEKKKVACEESIRFACVRWRPERALWKASAETNEHKCAAAKQLAPEGIRTRDVSLATGNFDKRYWINETDGSGCHKSRNTELSQFLVVDKKTWFLYAFLQYLGLKF